MSDKRCPGSNPYTGEVGPPKKVLEARMSERVSSEEIQTYLDTWEDPDNERCIGIRALRDLLDARKKVEELEMQLGKGWGDLPDDPAGRRG